MEREDRIILKREFVKRIRGATKVICVSLIIMMYIVTFSSVVNKYMSEVGTPTDGSTDVDWYIEPGDYVIRENEFSGKLSQFT